MMAPDLDALPPMDVASRARRVREALDGATGVAVDALLVTKLVNLRWLTGFTGSAGRAVLLADRLVLVTDGRYETQAGEQLAAAGVDADVRIGRSAAAQQELLQQAVQGVARLGLEADDVSWADQRHYADTVDAELVPTDPLVDRLRVVKDDGEIARAEAAAAIADRALANVGARLLDEPTEEEFGLELDTEMRRLGASGPSFETIVASGSNGAKPHHRPASRRIVEGDLVVLDFGATVDGYRSDMTRTMVIGEPSETQQRMLDVVAEAQAAGVAAVRAGAACRDVDAACRKLIADAGWGDAFAHGTGHGVGLEIHEEPRVSFSAPEDATLAARSIVTVEPGVYLPAHGGVRVEDSVVVTDDGCRPLTHFSKDPRWPSRPTT
ncbi:MAG: aminopeptidase P family protein [Acidimicrobiales bacterium]